jgi:hypothetical protein
LLPIGFFPAPKTDAGFSFPFRKSKCHLPRSFNPNYFWQRRLASPGAAVLILIPPSREPDADFIPLCKTTPRNRIRLTLT